MDKYYVIVAGNGVTSRANLEALMEDHYYANGPKGILVLAFDGKPSQGQIFAAQLAKDKNIETVVFNTKDDAPGLPPCSVVVVDNPLLAAVSSTEGEKASAFVLWSDEDTDCLNLLAYCKKAGVPCFDLTDGLNPLTASPKAKAQDAPEIPEAEQEEVEEEYVLFLEDPEEEEDMEEDETLDEVYMAVEYLVQAIAKAVRAELSASNKPQKGSKKA